MNAFSLKFDLKGIFKNALYLATGGFQNSAEHVDEG
jgi:hypothetical protein